MGGHTGTHSKGAVLLAHAHIDGPLKAYLPTLERMADRADDIDEQILEHPDELALAALMYLKRSSLRLSRALAPQREVLGRLGTCGVVDTRLEARLLSACLTKAGGVRWPKRLS